MRSLSMRKLSDELEARYPGIVIGGVGDAAHQLEPSDHNEDDTPGSKPAQTDPDTIPEHRAIDAMLGPSFTATQAQSVINEILDREVNRERLWYINFQNWQWSRTFNWIRHDNSRDPHPDHIHFSGLASQDDNIAQWLSTTESSLMKLFVINEDGRVCATTGTHWFHIKNPAQLHAVARVWNIDLGSPSSITPIWLAELPGFGVNAETTSGDPGSGATTGQVHDIVREALKDFGQGSISAL